MSTPSKNKIPPLIIKNNKIISAPQTKTIFVLPDHLQTETTIQKKIN